VNEEQRDRVTANGEMGSREVSDFLIFFFPLFALRWEQRQPPVHLLRRQSE
jgi:hypothetical protein